MTSKTLYLLVTCSMDKGRESLAVKVCANLQAESYKHNFTDNLLVFDNASSFKKHYEFIPKKAKLFKSNKNIGYWSAVYWTLNNYKKVMGKNYDYIYIIESDLIHYSMKKLDICERFLNKNLCIGGVRTQKFNVRFRAFFNKKYHWIPFIDKSSLVTQINPFTKESVWFKKVKDFKDIYITNFHAKLPSLNRINSMKKVFNSLKNKKNIREIDFMNSYFHEHPIMAIIDGGLYRMLSTIETSYISGSYSSKEELKKVGYINTRVDMIISKGFSVRKIR